MEERLDESHVLLECSQPGAVLLPKPGPLGASLVASYLEKLNAFSPSLPASSIEPNLANLNALVLAHVDRIAYENIDIHAGRAAPALDPVKSAERIILRNRGGYCFLLVDAFAALLCYLNFNVSLHTAACGDHPQQRKSWGNHVVAVVHFDDGEYIADVGLGDGARQVFPLFPIHPDEGGGGGPAAAGGRWGRGAATDGAGGGDGRENGALQAKLTSTTTSLDAATPSPSSSATSSSLLPQHVSPGQWVEGGFTFRFSATPSAISNTATTTTIITTTTPPADAATTTSPSSATSSSSMPQHLPPPPLVYRWDNDASASFQGFDVSVASSATAVAEFTDFHKHLWVDPTSCFVSAGVVIHRKTPSDDGVLSLHSCVLRRTHPALPGVGASSYTVIKVADTEEEWYTMVKDTFGLELEADLSEAERKLLWGRVSSDHAAWLSTPSGKQYVEELT